MAAEIQVDDEGIIRAVGVTPGAAEKGWRTIDAALLKGPIRDDLIGRSAADVIEVAVDYKTGNASLKGVTQMEALIKAPYVKLEKGGNLLAVANDKLARMANAIKTTTTKALEEVKSSMQSSPAPGEHTKQVVTSIEKEFFTSRLGKQVLKAIPIAGWGVQYAMMIDNWNRGRYFTATLDAIGLVPVAGDVVDVARIVLEPSNGFEN